MNVATTIPPTVEIKRTRLLGVIVAVAAVAAAVTWAVTAFAVDNGSPQAQRIPTQATVRSVNLAPVGSNVIPASGYLDTLQSEMAASTVIPASGFLNALKSVTPGGSYAVSASR